MTEKEAIALLNKMFTAIQKTKSNMIEGLCGDNRPNDMEKEVLATLDPILFPEEGKINIITAIMKATAGDRPLAPVDLMNILSLANRSDGILLGCKMFDIDVPNLSPLPGWVSGWEQE